MEKTQSTGDLSTYKSKHSKSSRSNLPPSLQTTINTAKSLTRLSPRSLSLSNQSLPLAREFNFSESNLLTVSKLGAGAFGSVTMVIYKPRDITMARKVLRLNHDTREEDEARILREINILIQCTCPNIVTFYGCFQENNEINIMLEYMDVGSLESLYLDRGPIPVQCIKVIALHILRGLLYLLENQEIVHRDLKPANVLINSQGICKLSDFGLSKATLNSPATSTVGTVNYLAPEVLEQRLIQREIKSTRSDIWSLGLTLLEIALGRFAYETEILYEADKEFDDLLDMVKQNTPTSHHPTRTFQSQTFVGFARACLQKDPELRASARELVVRKVDVGDGFCVGCVGG